MSTNKIVIELENTILPEEAERLEDNLSMWLAREGYTGRLEDSITGNTRVFKYTPPKQVERRFNPQPKPEKRR